jgi:hypothetical protein
LYLGKTLRRIGSGRHEATTAPCGNNDGSHDLLMAKRRDISL